MIPPVAATPPRNPAERWLVAFEQHLVQVAGAALNTRKKYLALARRFVVQQFGDGSIDWTLLQADHIATFVTTEAETKRGFGRKAAPVAIRAVLRFLVYSGDIRAGLEAAVPAMRNWKHAALPRHISTDSEHLCNHKRASPQTIASCRDTFRLFLQFLKKTTGIEPAAMKIANLDAPAVLAFLDSLEQQRGHSVRSRNIRLAAIRSFFRLIALRDPDSIGIATRVLAIPVKREDKKLVGYLTREEIDAILAVPDRSDHRTGMAWTPFRGSNPRSPTGSGQRLRAGKNAEAKSGLQKILFLPGYFLATNFSQYTKSEKLVGVASAIIFSVHPCFLVGHSGYHAKGAYSKYSISFDYLSLHLCI